MNEMRTEARQKLGTFFREDGGAAENRPQIALESDEFAPLICRVVRAVRWRWALGLDSRWGTPLRSVSTPNLRLRNLLIRNLGADFHISWPGNRDSQAPKRPFLNRISCSLEREGWMTPRGGCAPPNPPARERFF